MQYNLYFQEKGLKTLQKARNHNQKARDLKRKLFLLQATSEKTEVGNRFSEFKSEFRLFSEEAMNLWIKEDEDSIQKVFRPGERHENTGISFVFYTLSRNIKDLDSISLNKQRERSELILQSADLLDEYIKLSELELKSYDQKNSKNLKQFRYFELSILIITLITLLLEAFFIFRPALRKLEEAQRARSDFFSRIGHEIRNPMNSILGMTTLLEKKPLDRDQKTYLFRLKKSAEGLLHFLNNVIEHSGIEQGRVTLNQDKIDIKELIEEISSLFYFDTGRKKLGFYISILGHFPKFITTDYIKLKYILINLIGNSTKFTEKGYISLVLSFDWSRQTLVLRIKDTGPGIDDDYKESIFDSFTQADSSVKRKYGGTGLGLSIVSEYVQLFKGDIELESEVGTGSSFTIELPITEYSEATSFKLPRFDIIFVQRSEGLFEWVQKNASEKSEVILVDSLSDIKEIKGAQKTKAFFINQLTDEIKGLEDPTSIKVFFINFSHENITSNIRPIFPALTWSVHKEQVLTQQKERTHIKSLDGQNALVCDDIEDNRLILNSHLQQHFSHIDTAKGGHDCLEALDQKKYSVVFLDIQMPDLDGLSVIKTARKSSKHKNTMFVAFTAHNSSIEKDKMLGAGFSFILEKPIREAQLNEILKKIAPKTPKKSNSTISFEERIRLRMLKKRPQFIKEKLKQIDQIKASKGDKKRLAKTFGHQLKGSAPNYGLQELSALGKSIEECAKEEDLIKLVNKVERILKEADPEDPKMPQS